MGILTRRRSFLIKLVVVISTAWFTIAFLLYSENQSDPIALPLQQAPPNLPPQSNNQAIEIVVDDNEVLREEPFQKPAKNKVEESDAVIMPPDGGTNAGEMGKPVILPKKLPGETFVCAFQQRNCGLISARERLIYVRHVKNFVFVRAVYFITAGANKYMELAVFCASPWWSFAAPAPHLHDASRQGCGETTISPNPGCGKQFSLLQFHSHIPRLSQTIKLLDNADT